MEASAKLRTAEHVHQVACNDGTPQATRTARPAVVTKDVGRAQLGLGRSPWA